MTELQSNVADRQMEAAEMVSQHFLYSPLGEPLHKNAFIAAGVVSLLVAMLRADQPGVQQSATCALRSVGAWEHKDALIAAGAVPDLVAMLRSHQPHMQMTAANILGCLAEGPQQSTNADADQLQPHVSDEEARDRSYVHTSGAQRSRDAIIAAGAVPLLVAMIGSDIPYTSKSDDCLEVARKVSYVQDVAAYALGNLAAGSQQNNDAVMAAGAVPVLVTMLRSHQPKAQQIAAATLARFAKGSQHSSDAVIAAGAVPLLVALLGSDQANVQTRAAHALAYVAASSQQSSDVVLAAGAVPPLIAWLRPMLPDFLPDDLHEDLHLAAATTLRSLAHQLAPGWQQSREAIMAAGAIPPLVAMLRSMNSLVLAHEVAHILGDLAIGCRQSQDAIVAAGAVPLLVALLSACWPNTVICAAEALGKMVDGCEGAIIAAGAVPLLIVLLRSKQTDIIDVQDAAVQALNSLASCSQHSRDIIIAAGAVPLLIAMSKSSYIAMQVHAAAAVRLLAPAL